MTGHPRPHRHDPNERGEHDHPHGDHAHEVHDHEDATGSTGVVLSVLRPHSHDAADSVDSALEASREGIRAVRTSLAALFLTAVAQLAVVMVTGSVALLADTIHNFSDALTAIPLWIAFVLGRRAATRRYTYGYGRAEDLAGVFIVAMIALSAALAAYEAVRRIVDPQPLSHPWVVLAAGVIGFIGNELVAVYRIRVGRRIGSAALVADGLHARTDGFTSLAVVAGTIGVMLGFPLADPIIGLLIAIAILLVLRGAARDVCRRLMDAVDPALVEDSERALTGVPGIVGVDRVRLRWIGHSLHAEADVRVEGTVDVRDAHDIAHAAEDALRDAVARLDDATVHVGPALRAPSSPKPALTADRPENLHAQP